MSFKIPANLSPPSDSGSDSASDDGGCSDWASSLGEARKTQSLFDDSIHPSPEAALAADKAAHGFDLRAASDRLGLDIYGRMRLINLIRKEKLSPGAVEDIQNGDARLKDDALLAPVLADDPLLRELSSDATNSQSSTLTTTGQMTKTHPHQRHVRHRRKMTSWPSCEPKWPHCEQLSTARWTARRKRRSVTTIHTTLTLMPRMTFTRLCSRTRHERSRTRGSSSVTPKCSRTPLSWTLVPELESFQVGVAVTLLTIVLAARAGAKHVYAIEASGLATKTRENIAANGLSDVITCVCSGIH